MSCFIMSDQAHAATANALEYILNSGFNHIPAGKTESVAIPLTGENFEWFDVESNTMCPLEGTYELLYGGTSDRNKLKTIVMNVQ